MERNIRNILIVLRGPREERDHIFGCQRKCQPGPGALKAEYPRQTVGEGHSRHGNNMYNGMEHTQGIVFFFFLFVVDFVIH